jgi:hypothetical protein
VIATILILLFSFPVRGFIHLSLGFSASSDEAVEEEAKVQELAPSVSSASKEKPPKEPIKEVPVEEPPRKAVVEAKTKRRKRDTSRPEFSLERHQSAPSLNDVSILLCYLFWFC